MNVNRLFKGVIMTAEKEILDANDRFYQALNTMFTGRTSPMQEVWSHADDVTLEGPFGGTLLGYEDVIEEFRREADMHLAGKVEPVDVLVRTGTDLAYVTCSESGKNMTVDGKPIIISHRATNIFRKEGGVWKMVHHHADISNSLQAAQAAMAV
jgi:ketosteroid isomerase-like protein